MNRSAFTLLEILVVAAITLILLSVALPTFSRITKKADTTACAANLRSMALGIASYVGENNGTLPGPTSGTQYAFYTAANVRNPVHLIAFLAPYLDLPTEPATRQFPKVAACPSARRAAGEITTDNARYFSTYHTVMDDGTEQRPFGYESSSTTIPIPPMKAMMVKEPQRTVAMADRNFHTHDGTVNVLFVDGHVENLTDRQIFYPRSGRIQLGAPPGGN